MIETGDETGSLDPGVVERISRLLSEYVAEVAPQEVPEGMPRFSLIFVSDSTISELNARDRGLDGPTDVLSYPVHEPGDVGFPQLPFLGDVIISVETAARQAAEAGHDLESELLVLAAHGLTHLRGYDHQTEDEWRVFETAQSRILKLARDGRS